MKRASRLLTLVVFVVCLIPCIDAVEFNTSVQTAQANGKQDPVASTDDTELLAKQLVKDYLPELQPVLASLQKHSANEYRKAVNDLARTSRRLQTMHVRDTAGYEIEVSLVQWQTRSDLALAQLQVHDDSRTRSKLREAIKNREQVRLQRAQHERSRIQERMDKMQSQLSRLDKQINDTDIDMMVEKAYAMATRKLDRQQELSGRDKNKSTKTSESK